MRFHVDSMCHKLIDFRRCTLVLVLKECHIQRNESILLYISYYGKMIVVLFYKNATSK